mgnify:CR=1 FL=1
MPSGNPIQDRDLYWPLPVNTVLFWLEFYLVKMSGFRQCEILPCKVFCASASQHNPSVLSVSDSLSEVLMCRNATCTVSSCSWSCAHCALVNFVFIEISFLEQHSIHLSKSNFSKVFFLSISVFYHNSFLLSKFCCALLAITTFSQDLFCLWFANATKRIFKNLFLVVFATFCATSEQPFFVAVQTMQILKK